MTNVNQTTELDKAINGSEEDNLEADSGTQRPDGEVGPEEETLPPESEENEEQPYDDEGDFESDEEEVVDEEEPDVQGRRLDQMESQMGQMMQAVTQIATSLQSRPQHQAPAGPQSAVPAYTPTRVPDSVDDMSLKEAAQYVLSEAGKQSSGITMKAIQNMSQQQGRVLEMYGEILEILNRNNPELSYIREAVAMSQRSPGISFKDAYDTAKGKAAGQANQKLQSQVQRNQKANKKRANKARRHSRPSPAAKRTEKISSFADAFNAAVQEVG